VTVEKIAVSEIDRRALVGPMDHRRVPSPPTGRFPIRLHR